jgi:hypothetical protein
MLRIFHISDVVSVTSLEELQIQSQSDVVLEERADLILAFIMSNVVSAHQGCGNRGRGRGGPHDAKNQLLHPLPPV